MELKTATPPRTKPLIHFYLKSLSSQQKDALANKLNITCRHLYRLQANPGGITFKQLQIIVPFLEKILGVDVRGTFLNEQPKP